MPDPAAGGPPANFTNQLGGHAAAAIGCDGVNQPEAREPIDNEPASCANRRSADLGYQDLAAQPDVLRLTVPELFRIVINARKF